MNPDLESVGVATRPVSPSRARALRSVIAIGLGALLVAISAQFAVPVPFSPVPMTLQPLAVLAVGGLLGPARGVGALLLYIVMGVVGLPVFAGGGSGIVHLIGPTGGYLLAFPVAAGLTGALVGQPPHGILRVLLAAAAGMIVIHVGGVAQLAILGRDPALALRVGFIPFLTGDLLKVGLAALLILMAGPRVRALL